MTTDDMLELIHRRLRDFPSEALRIFHGRGGTGSDFSHLNIEWLPPYLMLVNYHADKFEQCQQLAHDLWSKLKNKKLFKCILYQGRYGEGKLNWQQLQGNLPEAELTSGHVVQEMGLNYNIQFFKNQNVGLFLQTREARRYVMDNCRQLRLLNLFSYTCAFSVAALAGGAGSVLNMDMKSSLLSQGRSNHKINGQDISKVEFFKADIKKSLGKIRRSGPYDLIIYDPPSHQSSFKAQNDYISLLQKIVPCLNPDGRLLLLLNDPMVSMAQFKQWLTPLFESFEIKQQLPLPLFIQESDAGLKQVVLKKTDGKSCLG